MNVTWLGQAGLLFSVEGQRILIDPYFSSSVEKVNPAGRRRMRTPDWVWDIRPDVLIFTHDHLDHYDPETAPRILQSRKSITVLCAPATWEKARQCGGGHNYVRFARHAEWTQGGVRFSAVKAEHSDPAPIGVVLSAEGKTIYVTGDTLFSGEIFPDLPQGIDVIFLPVNGAGNNMNAADAARFAAKTGAKRVVPLHVGLFDELTTDVYTGENKWALKPFQEYEL
ncbi:MAG: MBL fold metallo-hydrolase [Oscillospiraceae bacterium]|nr:MBL fold metallo-hydrolase [Oscillospiraceae bacterium]